MLFFGLNEPMKKLLLYTSLIFSCSGLFAQHRQLDSLNKVLESVQSDTGKVSVMNEISEILWRTGNYDSAMTYAQQAMEMAEKDSGSDNADIAKKGKILLAQAYRLYGIIYRHHGNYSKSLEYHLRALALNKETGNKSGIMVNLNNIGIVYWNMENYPKALEYFKNALDLAEAIGDKNNVGANIGNLGILYRDMGNYSKALEYDLKAMAIEQETGDQGGVATNLGNIGLLYTLQGDYAKAMDYNKRALAIDESIGDKVGMATNMNNIGNIYRNQRKFSFAKAYYDSAMAIALELGEKNQIKEVYQNRFVLDSLMGDFGAEAEDFKKFITYRDSLLSEENIKKATQAEMNYEFEQKQLVEKAAQEKKDAIAAAEKKRQEAVIWFVSIGLIVVIVFSVMLFSRFRLTQKQKKIIEDQKGMVEEKNKELLDSINYAKRLQDAMHPPLAAIKKHFPESFVLYKPKDIVAGDFYWMETAGNHVLLAAADCTGHGVPGAMVSVLCSNALKSAVKEFKIYETGKILDKVTELVLEAFEKSESEVKDGMDISLCRINKSTGEAEWSGAYNPLCCVKDGKLVEVFPDKQPVGMHDNIKPFTTHKLNLKKGDMLYLFTDGYADQFGGPKGKKFKYKQLQETILAIKNESMESQKVILEKKLAEWMGSLEQLDDVLIMGISV